MRKKGIYWYIHNTLGFRKGGVVATQRCFKLRVQHGYGKTCRFSKTGSAGTGMVVNFGKPQYTMYPYHIIMDMYR